MAQFCDILSSELTLGRVELLKRIGGENWSYKCGDANIFVKTSKDVLTVSQINIFTKLRAFVITTVCF